jgi:hypothetical protein
MSYTPLRSGTAATLSSVIVVHPDNPRIAAKEIDTVVIDLRAKDSTKLLDTFCIIST